MRNEFRQNLRLKQLDRGLGPFRAGCEDSLARQKAGCVQSGKRLASRPVKLRARLRPAVNSRSNWNGPKLRTALP